MWIKVNAVGPDDLPGLVGGQTHFDSFAMLFFAQILKEYSVVYI